MDPREADRLDEVDMLKLELANLRIMMAKKEFDSLGAVFNIKYGAPNGLQVNADGTFIRTAPKE